MLSLEALHRLVASPSLRGEQPTLLLVILQRSARIIFLKHEKHFVHSFAKTCMLNDYISKYQVYLRF